ncbi:glycosyltransferase family 2 protein [Dankookia sp. P2]|uniref:glycosyltransferase family 2 protein n=1 Tax=Dankookia sp. P2 TaxID=3423955 RepID=UPI003D67B393
MKSAWSSATRGRDRELDALFESLAAQRHPNLEVIVVDQNADDRLAPVMAAWRDRLALRWERTVRAHANHARNLGLALARGDIVGFPDDDCSFPPGVLARVLDAFADPALAILTGPAASPEGGLGSGRWRAEAGPIDAANVWTSVIEFNLFLRRKVALALGGFDERLGPGTPLGSTEGNDLVLRAVRAGHVARYDPAQRIVHPDKRLTPVAVERAALYARGMGFVLRRHAVPAGVWLPFMVRPLGGILVSALRGRMLAARYYAATLRGRLAGFLTPGAAAGLPLPALAER